MPASIDIANGVASYFKDGTSDAGKGDSETAAAHKAASDELDGSICPDCNAHVKSAMVTAFGQPASVASADDLARQANDAKNMNIVKPVNPLDKIRDPKNLGVYTGD